MRFSKWHGLGNDYLLVERADSAAARRRALVRRLCDYHLGVGSDGILEVLAGERRACRDRHLEPGRLDRRALRQRHAHRRPLAGPPKRGRTRCGSASGPREVVARMRGGLEVETEMGAVEVG